MSDTSIELTAVCYQNEQTQRKALRFEDREFYNRSVDTLTVGERYDVTIDKHKAYRKKTHEQVKYWWAVPIPLLAEHCGETDKQMHRDLMVECFGTETNAFGKVVPIEPSMTDLTVEKMKHLIDWVLDWAPAELEVIIPPPDKNWRQHAEQIRKQRRGHAA